MALLALFLVGCRGVLGIEPLPGIRADAGAADRDVPDATRDAPVEAAPTDATTEATPDAGPTFCSTVPSPPPGHHVLCSDFDEAQDGFESGWDNADQDPDPGDINGGVLATDAKLHWSAPRSLLATTPETVSSTADVSAILLKTIPGSGSSVLGSLVLEFELYVEELDIPSSGPSSGYILVSSVDYGVGGVILYLDSAGLEFEIAPQLDVVHHVLVPFPTGQWVKVTLLIEDAPTDGGPDGWAYVDCAGNDANSTLPAAFQQVSGDLRVTLGSSAIGPVGAFKANYDDVVLGWGPP